MDTLDGAYGPDKVYGGSDEDTLRGGEGSDPLYGGSGIGALFGMAQADIVSGDAFYGGSGNDTLILCNGAEIPGGVELNSIEHTLYY